jgi:hypothetical protein
LQCAICCSEGAAICCSGRPGSKRERNGNASAGGVQQQGCTQQTTNQKQDQAENNHGWSKREGGPKTGTGPIADRKPFPDPCRPSLCDFSRSTVPVIIQVGITTEKLMIRTPADVSDKPSDSPARDSRILSEAQGVSIVDKSSGNSPATQHLTPFSASDRTTGVSQRTRSSNNLKPACHACYRQGRAC